ncbi:hypothetical protein KRR55_02645 [Paeniglutamicibacter sp. ABSL32-1]|uniref:hypothetical protein n=1 Tax=Paeniglutamicibacter quisquiliarum TaxID=2849498 RepID=UPI001C2D79FF|nr:hypothetical protein [Paeniglutamicibacter quisquiliarum]MBV1778011.1 hypothetical protein [Paeniglutamicibacter quisquiliarum]
MAILPIDVAACEKVSHHAAGSWNACAFQWLQPQISGRDEYLDDFHPARRSSFPEPVDHVVVPIGCPC